jgi:1-acyl-sn-glycerol-3-phosphate acyltransferase
MAIVIFLRWMQIRILHIQRDRFKTFLLRIAQLGFRCLFFAFGHLYIKVNGKIDKDARVIVSNHTCFHDAMIIICCRDASVVAKIEFQSVFMWLFDIIDPIYVRRDQHGGQTQLVKDHINNKDLLPILIFPEGTITNGDVLLKFHRSPFLSEHKVQPMMIRYWMPFVPKGWNSFAWTHKSTLSFFWSVLSMPFSFVVVDILPSSSIQQYESVDAMAEAVQLQCANALGVKAVTRSSNEIFMKKKAAKEAAKTVNENQTKDKVE